MNAWFSALLARHAREAAGDTDTGSPEVDCGISEPEERARGAS